MKQLKKIALVVIGAGLTSLLLYSCSEYEFERSDPSAGSIKQKHNSTSSIITESQEDFGIGEVIDLESRLDLNTKVKLEITKVNEGGYKIRKWVSTISQNDPLDYYAFIIGADIVNSSDNSLMINLTPDKVFKEVRFDPSQNDPVAIPIGGWNFTCHCCAGGHNGETPTGFGMCKVIWGRYKGILVVNCEPENCITGCGMEAGPIGGTAKRPDFIILDAAKVSIELMQ